LELSAVQKQTPYDRFDLSPKLAASLRIETGPVGTGAVGTRFPPVKTAPLLSGGLMDTIIVVTYSVCASALLIWCSVRTNLSYVAISHAELNIWRIARQNLIVIDLVPKSTGWHYRRTFDSLEVSEVELAGVLRWLPPNSTVVVCHRVDVHHFDGQIEETLLRAFIDTVYLLDVRKGARLQ
jgi:hypothetical protein